MKSFLFVVDTDSYAGNFIREMSAYMTGLCNEYGGESDAAAFLEETKSKDPLPFVELRVTDDDDVPTDEVACLCDGKGGRSNSFGIYCERRPKKAEIELMKERAYKFAKDGGAPPMNEWHKPIKIKGFRLVEEVTKQKSENV